MKKIKMHNKYFHLGIDWEDIALIAFDNKKQIKYKKFANDFKYENEYLLNLLKKLNINCTFFANGRTAIKYPEILQKVNNLGFEIGSHGFKHVHREALTNKDFYNDCLKSKNIIEDIIQKKVKGYRSPYLSMSRSNYIENLKILKKAGFVYDSSITYHKFVNISRNIELRNFRTPIDVIPLTSLIKKNLGFNLAGGSTWRVLPSIFTKSILKSSFSTQNTSIYLHPYEFGKNINPFRLTEESNYLKAIYLYFRWNLNRKSIEKIITNLSISNSVFIVKSEDMLKDYHVSKKSI